MKFVVDMGIMTSFVFFFFHCLTSPVCTSVTLTLWPPLSSLSPCGPYLMLVYTGDSGRHSRTERDKEPKGREDEEASAELSSFARCFVCLSSFYIYNMI